MSDGWLISSFVSLVSIGLIGLLYPLQLKIRTAIVLSIILVLMLFMAYLRWGTFFDWHEFAQQQQRQKQVKTLLATSDGRETVIRELKKRLTNTPENAYGWVLLAKLYLAQGLAQEAREAFAMADRLHPT